MAVFVLIPLPSQNCRAQNVQTFSLPDFQNYAFFFILLMWKIEENFTTQILLMIVLLALGHQAMEYVKPQTVKLNQKVRKNTGQRLQLL